MPSQLVYVTSRERIELMDQFLKKVSRVNGGRQSSKQLSIIFKSLNGDSVDPAFSESMLKRSMVITKRNLNKQVPSEKLTQLMSLGL